MSNSLLSPSLLVAVATVVGEVVQS